MKENIEKSVEIKPGLPLESLGQKPLSDFKKSLIPPIDCTNITNSPSEAIAEEYNLSVAEKHEQEISKTDSPSHESYEV